MDDKMMAHLQRMARKSEAQDIHDWECAAWAHAEIERLRQCQCDKFRVSDGVREGWCYSWYDHFDVFWDIKEPLMEIAELSVYGIAKIGVNRR